MNPRGYVVCVGVSSQPTYEDLKLSSHAATSEKSAGSQPTYEDLKPLIVSVASAKPIGLVRSLPTRI